MSSHSNHMHMVPKHYHIFMDWRADPDLFWHDACISIECFRVCKSWKFFATPCKCSQCLQKGCNIHLWSLEPDTVQCPNWPFLLSSLLDLLNQRSDIAEEEAEEEPSARVLKQCSWCCTACNAGMLHWPRLTTLKLIKLAKLHLQPASPHDMTAPQSPALTCQTAT